MLAHGPDGALIDTVASLPGSRFEPVSDLPGFFLMPVFHPGSLVAGRGGRDSPGWSAPDEASIGDSRAVAELFPTASDLMFGRAGRLWVKRFARPREEPEWLAFAPDGGLVCRFTPGSDLTPYEFGSDYMLALRIDDLGTERVMLYRLQLPDDRGGDGIDTVWSTDHHLGLTGAEMLPR